jgi:hypothetical protein
VSFSRRDFLERSAALAAAVVALFTVPVADRTHAPGIVWLPDEAFVRLHKNLATRQKICLKLKKNLLS